MAAKGEGLSPAEISEHMERLNKSIETVLINAADVPEVEIPAQFRIKSMRDAFQQAFEMVGGMHRLALYAHQNYERFLQHGASKLLPVAVAGDPGRPVVVQLDFVTGRRLEQVREQQGIDAENAEILAPPAVPAGE